MDSQSDAKASVNLLLRTENIPDTAAILGADVFQEMNMGDVVEMATGPEILKYRSVKDIYSIELM